MAEGRTQSREKIVCQYYLNSSCRNGARCKYSHDAPRNSLDRPCRFYLQGRCKFGQYCIFDHIKPKNGIVKNNSQNDNTSPNTSKYAMENREPAQLNQPSTSKADGNKCKFYNLYEAKKDCAANLKLCNQDYSKWINAPEFIPKNRKSYAESVKSKSLQPISMTNEMCPYSKFSECLNPNCEYMHYEICDVCHIECLHPSDNVQRKSHKELCDKEFEKDMELSFAIQRSSDKTCGICFDIILEKEPISERQFGILENCNHIFCLSCIRKWRSVVSRHSQSIEDDLDSEVTRGCPECRVPSNFVTPSHFWIENEEEKEKIIKNYKDTLSKKPCKYFRQGKGNCPFGGACFYLHAKPDGTKVELPLPTRRRRQNQNGELDLMNHLFLWDFLENREENLDEFLMHLAFNHLISGSSDSDDDDDDLEDIIDDLDYIDGSFMFQ